MAVSVEYVKYQPEQNPEAVMNYYSYGAKTGKSKNPVVKDMILKAKKHLSSIGWSFFYIYKNHDRRELRYRSPAGRSYYSLRTACQHVLENPKKPQPETLNPKPEKTHNRPKKKIRMEDVENSYFQQKRDQSIPNNNNDHGIIENKEIIINKRNDFKPRKLIRKADASSCSSTRGRRCILSLLIEEKILLSGSRVSYCKKDGRVLAKGRVYDSGIRCDCCDEFFLLSKFEAHAGSTYHRPAANIFLDDGRSIFDCQTQLQRENKPVNVSKSIKSMKPIGNDDFCAFCSDGGELVLCDSCTCSFHLTCIGLSTIPDSDYWFCPSCCCKICHEGNNNNNSNNNNPQIKCGQCDRQFHMDCLNKLGFLMTDLDHDKWFCSETCERICSGLKRISRKPVMLTEDGLSWRIMKLDSDEKHAYEYTETYGKLNVALDVMHECFQPIKHRLSDSDLVEDLVFSRGSNRSNFKGFFTVVLERDDEMITVATVRVYGGKVAEIPLVATRFRYRRLGMCRVLMDEIERKLGGLGVERLVLPAVPEMINTWTGSFGFKVMTEVERMELVEYKFLDFSGSIKCHKMLK